MTDQAVADTPARTPLTLGSVPVTVNAVDTLTGVWACMEWLDTLDRTMPVGLDVETTGLDMFAPGFSIRTVQLSDGHTAWVLRCEEHHTVGTIQSMLRNPTLFFVTHGQYDALALRAAWGIDLTGRVLDSHLLSRLVHPSDDEDHDLKALATKWLGAPQLQEAQDILQSRFRELAREQGVKDLRGKNQLASWGFPNINTDDPVFVQYAALDAAACVRLAPALVKVLGTGRNVVPMEMRLADIATGMRVRGIRLDVPRTQTLVEDCNNTIDHQEALIVAATGVGARSPKLADWLTDQGFVFAKDEVTIGGRPSLSKEYIDTQVGRAEQAGQWQVHEVLSAKRLMMEQTNDLANLEGFLKFADHTGRLHPDTLTLRARTARMSIRAPPLQTLKKDEESVLRPCLMADEGMVLISVDLAQVELRVAAALAGETNMITPILAGTDLHSDTARRIFGPEFTPKQRAISKLTNFASLYGAGAKTIANGAGIGFLEAKSIVEKWREAYPRVALMAKSLSERNEITTPTGRVIPIDPTRPYAAINYLVQSTARDLFVIGVLRVADQLGLENNILLLIHDEVVLQAPQAEAEQVLASVVSEFEFTLYGVPITASGEILGPRWGKA